MYFLRAANYSSKCMSLDNTVTQYKTQHSDSSYVCRSVYQLMSLHVFVCILYHVNIIQDTKSKGKIPLLGASLNCPVYSATSGRPVSKCIHTYIHTVHVRTCTAC